MLYDTFILLCAELEALETRTSLLLVYAIVVLLALVTLLLFWRLWRFTLTPCGKPDTGYLVRPQK